MILLITKVLTLRLIYCLLINSQIFRLIGQKASNVIATLQLLYRAKIQIENKIAQKNKGNFPIIMVKRSF